MDSAARVLNLEGEQSQLVVLQGANAGSSTLLCCSGLKGLHGLDANPFGRVCVLLHLPIQMTKTPSQSHPESHLSKHLETLWPVRLARSSHWLPKVFLLLCASPQMSTQEAIPQKLVYFFALLES